jgi:hypothetical protein
MKRAHADLGTARDADVHGDVSLVVPACQLRVDGGAIVILEEVVDGELNLAPRCHARASRDRDGEGPVRGIGSDAAPPPGEATGGGESLNVSWIDFEQAEDVEVGVGDDLLLPSPSARAAETPQVQEPKVKGGCRRHAS